MLALIVAMTVPALRAPTSAAVAPTLEILLHAMFADAFTSASTMTPVPICGDGSVPERSPPRLPTLAAAAPVVSIEPVIPPLVTATVGIAGPPVTEMPCPAAMAVTAVVTGSDSRRNALFAAR